MSKTDDAVLLLLTESVDDLERVRVAMDNRVRALLAKDGVSPTEPEVVRLSLVAKEVRALELGAILDLKREMRKHPLWIAFGKDVKGCGEQQFARLIAAIGDPADRPNVDKLRQYCGHGDPERSQLRDGCTVLDDEGRKRHRLPFSPTAKMRTHLIAERVLQAQVRKTPAVDDSNGYDFRNRTTNGVLGRVYLDAREAWADRDTTDLHKHNHALRLVGKEILKDLWRAATDLRGGHGSGDIHHRCAPANQLRQASSLSAPMMAASGEDPSQLRGAIPGATPTLVSPREDPSQLRQATPPPTPNPGAPGDHLRGASYVSSPNVTAPRDDLKDAA